MNNHYKTNSLYVVLSAKVWENFFGKKMFFTAIQKKGSLKQLPNCFHGKTQTLNFKIS